MAGFDPEVFGGSSSPGFDPEVFASPQASQALESKPKKPAGPPVSPIDKLSMGLGDMVHGGAQLLTKALPTGVVDAGNQLNNWLADKGVPLARIPERNLSGLITGQTGGVDQMVKDRERAYEAKRSAAGETGVDWWRIGGNMLNPANYAFGGPGLTQAILSGTVTSTLQPSTGDDFWADKGRQAAIGGVGGAGAFGVGKAVGRVISPQASQNADLALLKAEGVKPTIGQTLGGRWNAAEEKLQSLPIIGDAISMARDRARQQFNEAALNRAGAPVGAKANGTGQDAVGEMRAAIGQAYDAARAQMGHFQIDQQGKAELVNLRNMVQNLPAKEQQQFMNLWGYLKNEVSPNGSITADSFKRLDSKLGKDAALFNGSTDAYQQQLGSAVSELQRVITENARRANPRADEMFKKADAAYANLVRVEGASKAAMNSGGVFTPGQLQSAVRQADRSTRKNATARGDALMQDLSGAGQSVLGNKVPNSGTADRLLMGGGTLGGAFMVDPLVAAGVVGGAAAYSPPAQSLLRGLLSSRPAGAKAAAEKFDALAPYLLPSGGLLGLEYAK